MKPSPESVEKAQALIDTDCPHYPSLDACQCETCLALALDAERAAGKAEGMEEAAKACDALFTPRHHPMLREGAAQAAYAIRARAKEAAK